jgi:transcriptional regulator with XRE-family HTH domain
MRRKRTVRRAARRVALSELRAALGITQTALAETLGTSQEAVLKIERAEDPRLSSVRRYVTALGAQLTRSARLELVAIIAGQQYALALPKEERMNVRTAVAPVTAAVAAAPDNSSGHGVAWRLRAWDDSLLEQRFLDDNLIAISDDRLGNLTDWPDEATLERRLREAHPTRGRQAIGTFMRYWKDFRIGMQPGDLVVVPLSGRRAAIGEITGDYEYAPTENERKLRHRRAVRWDVVVSRDDLDEDLRKVVNAPGTICRFRALDAAARLRHATGGDS